VAVETAHTIAIAAKRVSVVANRQIQSRAVA
jgi:hypothetical protein